MQNLKLDTNSILTDIKNKLRKSYDKLETDLAVSKEAKVRLELKSWVNEQYSYRECL